MGAPASTLTPLAVYRRDIGASLERIWENVLDWEHLPWLHRGAFLDVHLLAEWHGGWRAEVLLPSASEPRPAEIEVGVERDALRYRTRTLSGLGAGSDIVTELHPRESRTTAITVAFHVPGVAPINHDAVAALYTGLYERLWNEDEAMMIRRQALLDAAAGRRGFTGDGSVALGTADELRRRLPVVLSLAGREVRVVEIDGEIVAHDATCPHRGGPLAATAVEDGCITCPWHGYRFDVRTGGNADGRRLRLARPPRVLTDARTGAITLVAD